ncbi:hypothetical protein [Comamonas sp. NoAH]|uniref:hypothetical protein n=1 Tax=Comamonas halotolerans TaxID=3041496 RepID=UPI0024E1291B|nr:hypothetical protein [Comamonas sp. NoAH]
MAAKMWILGIGLMLTFILLGIAVGLFIPDAGAGTDAVINLISLVTSIFFGIKGNIWRESNLLSRGFEQKDKVWAINKDQAVANFLKDLRMAQ